MPSIDPNWEILHGVGFSASRYLETGSSNLTRGIKTCIDDVDYWYKLEVAVVKITFQLC